MSRFSLLVLALAAFSFSLFVMPGEPQAQQLATSTSSSAERYGGIIPGERDRLGDEEAAQRGPNRVTWIGFEAKPQSTRVFVQTARPARYQVREELADNRLVISIDGVVIRHTNFRRFIDASHFDRTVTRIESKQVGTDRAEVTLYLREGVSPSVVESAEYIFFEFPHDGPAPVAEEPTDEERARGDDQERSAALQAGQEEQRRSAEETDEPTFEARPLDDEPRQVQRTEDDLVFEEPGRRTWGLPVALVGLAMVGAGGGLHLHARSQRDEVESVPPGGVVPMTRQDALDVERRANQLDTTALGLAVTGGVLTAVGVGAFLMRPSGDSDNGLALVPTSDGLSLTMRVNF